MSTTKARKNHPSSHPFAPKPLAGRREVGGATATSTGHDFASKAGLWKYFSNGARVLSLVVLTVFAATNCSSVALDDDRFDDRLAEFKIGTEGHPKVMTLNVDDGIFRRIMHALQLEREAVRTGKPAG